MKSRSVNLLLLLGTVAFGLMAFALLLAFVQVDYRALFFHPVWPAFTDRFDPELLHIHPPHAQSSGTTRGGGFTASYRIPRSDMAEYTWQLKYDGNGFRNDRDLSSADIAVIGDSFVEAMTTPEADLLSTRLGDLEGKVSINLGQNGYGPMEELAVLRRYALPLHPRTVVWTFFEGNDLYDLAHWHVVDSQRRSAPLPQPEVAAFGPHKLIADLRARLSRARRPSGESRLGYIGSRDFYFYYRPPRLEGAGEIASLNETVGILAQAAKLCSAQGARFVVVFIPAKFRALRKLCSFPADSECRKWNASDLPQRLQESLAAAAPDAGYIDLTQDLGDAARAGNLTFYPDDDHWTPAGERIAALAIHDYLNHH